VGGGAAGSVVAGRLAADANISVLLLAAGPDYPDPTDLPDYVKFATEPAKAWWVRGFALVILESVY
jgi:choline dehydrogenase